jgi:hypothetical protein
MRRIFANRNAQRRLGRFDVRKRLVAKALFRRDHELIVAWIRRDDPHRQLFFEQAHATIRLRQHRRGVHERHLDAAPADILGENR